MRKFTALLMSAILVVTISAVSFAAEMGGNGNGQPRPDASANAQASDERREETRNRLEEFKAFQGRMKQHRERAIDEMQANNALRAENARLLGEFRDSLELLSEGETSLTEETMEAIGGYMEQIRAHRDELKETRIRMREILKANGRYRSEKNFDALENSFSEIASIQQERNQLMLRINECIAEMMKLLVSEV
ncbi:MAG: hypothetical protein PHN99_02415 [Eubacteriales bacterium]|jgi:Spy/CpxP family protein refolding chaperone|nr:hypothetical protein [Eubacteriales bacterium]MDD4326825.1 hypothetical protein [Eubacteriales bacterium]MDD4716948.1 hypothetical protein [Eubacteriales bacterium]NCU25550.1 hypothetical protein [Candidatus Nomurabacteria bacterium]